MFARDVGFVIDDKIIVSNIIPNREDEKEAYEVVYNQIAYNKIFNLPEKAHVEGGDVVLYNNIVFVGLYTQPDYPQMKTARTNRYAFSFLKEICPGKIFIPLELKKHNTDPRAGILHLDCTFMPVGKGHAIIYKDGFMYPQDYHTLLDLFGRENVFEITREEMYYMNTNVFSISPEVVVSRKELKVGIGAEEKRAALLQIRKNELQHSMRLVMRFCSICFRMWGRFIQFPLSRQAWEPQVIPCRCRKKTKCSIQRDRCFRKSS